MILPLTDMGDPMDSAAFCFAWRLAAAASSASDWNIKPGFVVCMLAACACMQASVLAVVDGDR